MMTKTLNAVVSRDKENSSVRNERAREKRKADLGHSEDFSETVYAHGIGMRFKLISLYGRKKAWVVVWLSRLGRASLGGENSTYKLVYRLQSLHFFLSRVCFLF